MVKMEHFLKHITQKTALLILINSKICFCLFFLKLQDFFFFFFDCSFLLSIIKTLPNKRVIVLDRLVYFNTLKNVLITN